MNKWPLWLLCGKEQKLKTNWGPVWSLRGLGPRDNGRGSISSPTIGAPSGLELLCVTVSHGICFGEEIVPVKSPCQACDNLPTDPTLRKEPPEVSKADHLFQTLIKHPSVSGLPSPYPSSLFSSLKYMADGSLWLRAIFAFLARKAGRVSVGVEGPCLSLQLGN